MADQDSKQIYYSMHYSDERSLQTYRYVVLPESLQRKVPTRKLLSEEEWKELGLIMRPGWCHVGWYRGKTTMLFRLRSEQQ